MPVLVYKFGGTSVGSAERMIRAARLVLGAPEGCGVVVVASAMAGVTNALLDASARAADGDGAGAMEVIRGLEDRHAQVLSDLGGDEAVAHRLARMFGQIRDLLRAAELIRELTPRTHDRLMASGEKLSVPLVSLALRRQGAESVALFADAFLETDGAFGEATPLAGVADRTIAAAIRPHLDAAVIPVVTGFCGRAPDGATTVFGRGGSDLTATVLAGALRADEVTLWSDVDGVFTADPRVVADARVIPQLHYREAAELSFYGAKVLHPRTMIPIADHDIPVRSRSTFHPQAPGTVVDGNLTAGSHPVKGISAVRGQCLLSLEGKGMAGVPGVAARLFAALARHRISVTMISQSSSESSICIAVPADQAGRAESAMKSAFRGDLAAGMVEEIVRRDHVGLVAAVGLGMAHTPGMAARLFGALGTERVNILAVAQGSSELNVSLAVDASDVDRSIRAIHRSFGLHRRDTGEDARHAMDLILLGCGQVGRQLLELVAARREAVAARFGLELRVVAVSDRSGFVLEPLGLDDDALGDLVAHKRAGRSLAKHPRGTAEGDSAAMLGEITSWRLSRPVLVDVTATGQAILAWHAAAEAGCDVVTANKVPLAGSPEDYQALVQGFARRGRLLKAEATVGAGLPVVDTLEMLVATGDRLVGVRGCLSGTLGLVMSRLEQGEALSDIVREASLAGYTEPDPVDDLCGRDVARKALILARWSGLEPPEVSLEGLVDPSLAGLGLDELVEHLRALDAPLAARADRARGEGKVLRYVAEVTAERIVVGLQAVPLDTPIGRLQGTDNTLVLRSERYATRPLVITGPGAGVDVTAMGVLADILRIAAERR